MSSEVGEFYDVREKSEFTQLDVKYLEEHR